MLKYEEMRDIVQTKFQGARIKAEEKVKNRIEENRAEEQINVDSDGVLDIEFSNYWREHVNEIKDGTLVFESSHKKIREQDGKFYVVNLRTPNCVLEQEESARENDEEESEQEEDEADETDEEDIREKLPSNLTLRVEDENGEIESFDLDIVEEYSEEEESEEDEEQEQPLRNPEAVDKLYLDVCVLFADSLSEQEDKVQIPYQKPVIRDEFEIEDITHAEQIVQRTVDRLDGDRIGERLQEADENDEL